MKLTCIKCRELIELDPEEKDLYESGFLNRSCFVCQDCEKQIDESDCFDSFSDADPGL